VTYTHTEGYQRDTIPSVPDDAAVRWWYFHRNDDGYCFARGGRVRTSRQARTAIHDARCQHREDERKTFELRHALDPALSGPKPTGRV
jgi:hypothetical protein